MSVEGALFPFETASRGRVVDTRSKILQFLTSKADPQNMRMLEVGKTSDPRGIEFEGRGISGNLLQIRLKAMNLFDRNGGAEEFQCEVEARR